MKKKLKRAKDTDSDGGDGSSSKKQEVTMTQEELGQKIKAAKESGAVNYREQVR